MPIIEPIKDVTDWTVDDWRGAFNTLSELYSKALARAEAAENDSRAWEALAARAEAIVMVQQDKIAELEAQLAAQEWRSGDEVPPAEGWYQTFNWGMYGHLYFSGGRWSKYPVPPKHWRSVGPPPSGDDSPG